MKRKILIHVGMGKTGSSSIQETLRKSEGKLLSHGVKYLGFMLERAGFSSQFNWLRSYGWPEFMATPAAQRDAEFLSVLFELDRTLPATVNTLLLSNESFFNSTSHLASIVANLREAFIVEVVGYIRSPGSWVQSAYVQWGLKHKTYQGNLKDFKQWSSEITFLASPFLNQWRRLADESSFYNFDAIDDVASHFIRCHLPQVFDDIQVVKLNETPHATAVALYAFHNSFNTEETLPNEVDSILLNSNMLGHVQSMSDYNTLLPNEIDVGAFIKRHEHEIALLNEYFTLTGQQNYKTDDCRVKAMNATQNDINRTLFELVVHMNRQIKDLQDKLASVNNHD